MLAPIRFPRRTITAPGRNCWKVSAARRCGLLIDGRDYYRAFYRGALEARHSILISGWQFDSTVELLRGRDARGARTPLGFLEFLDFLCARRPELRVAILAWNFSALYAPMREWLQEALFNRRANERLTFRFDDRHAVGACHHQKFVVIDSSLAFVGSMDLCEDRWDTPLHRCGDPRRVNAKGTLYEPYHEVQAVVSGPAAGDLAELFRYRWLLSGANDLPVGPQHAIRDVVVPTVPLRADRVSISRTLAQTLVPEQDSVRELGQLYLDAIDAADELIYIENQYFSSEAIEDALIRRMRDRSRPPIDIVLIYPKVRQAWVEEVALGMAQKRIFRTLQSVAGETGHRLGIYYSASRDGGDIECQRYIHSKLMIVDDRFLTVGSANTTNRSLGLDTELNLNWEAGPEDGALRRSIRRARVTLVAEHAGVSRRWSRLKLYRRRGLADVMDRLAEARASTLGRHPMDTSFDHTWLKLFVPSELSIDPARPVFEEEVGEPADTHAVVRRNHPLAVRRFPRPSWIVVARWGRRASILALALVLLYAAWSCAFS